MKSIISTVVLSLMCINANASKPIPIPSCVGMSATGEVENVILDVNTDSLITNGEFHKIEVYFKDKRAVATYNFISDKDNYIYSSLAFNSNFTQAALRQYKATTNVLVFQTILSCHFI